jgi:hypothetical protein
VKLLIEVPDQVVAGLEALKNLTDLAVAAGDASALSFVD